jgi:hypothetical protein
VKGEYMKLTDSEKREVFKFIEAGKLLPNKYRFFLFSEKREVEETIGGEKGIESCLQK